MPQRTYAIMGATGKIGHVLVEELLKRGHQVRAIGRTKAKLAVLEAKGAKTYAAAFDDAASLAKAFEGASAIFTMISPAYEVDDFSAWQDRTGEAIAQAIRQAKTTHVLSLSSIGAQWPSGTGPIAGLHRQEKRLNAISGLNVLHLRPAYFMENQFWSIPTIKQHEINGSPMRGDLPLLMVATRDIGQKAADLLDRLEFSGHSVVEFSGPRPYTLNEATTLLGKAIGKPDLKYVQFSYEDAKKAMLGMGMKPGMAQLMVEMDQAFNEGRLVSEGKLLLGKTTFEEFAAIFAKAYQSPEPAPV